MNAILARTALAHNQKYIGREIDVLVDSVEPAGDGLFANFGKSETFKTAKFLSAKEWVGQFAKVRVRGVTSWGLEGELV